MRGVRVVTHAADATPSYVRLPDGEVELVVRFLGPDVDAHVVGTRLQALHKGGPVVPPEAIAVRFKAGGAYPFFGVSMAALTDRLVSVDTLWGAEGARFRERVAEAATAAARVQVIEDVLTARLQRGDLFEPASAPVVRRAIRSIETGAERSSVGALARSLGISERQLRRGFDDVVGMGPKAFARVVRFQRALRAAARGTAPDWGAIAAATGYYDQAHLVGEVRRLTGTTPAALLRAAR